MQDRAKWLAEYRAKNSEALKAKNKEYNNRPEVKARKRLWEKTRPPEYYVKFREKAAKRAKIKRATNNQYKIAQNIRRNSRRLVFFGGTKKLSALLYVGCSWEYLVSYMEGKFKPGMNWGNYGIHGWHIDHIKPLSSFDLTDEKQVLEAMNYTNLQPLWATENWSKGGLVDRVA